MEKREYEVLWNYYYGIGKTPIASIENINKLDSKHKIKKIYEVIDNDYNEIWYLIKDVKERNYIFKSKYGNFYATDIMKKFKDKYKFYKITTDLIKMFDNNIYPIVFKVNECDFINFYDAEKNINKAFFNNYYCYINNFYKTIRECKNKVETETFEREEDAIYWCSNFNITKQEVLKKKEKELNLSKRVYDYNI